MNNIITKVWKIISIDTIIWGFGMNFFAFEHLNEERANEQFHADSEKLSY